MSAAEIRKVETEDGVISYDSNMPMRALKGLSSSADASDLDGISEALSQFVLEWPYDGDPATPEAWEDLRRKEFNLVLKSVMKDLGKLGEE